MTSGALSLRARLTGGPTLPIIGIGLMVGVSFTLAKFAVASGIPAFAALFWQMFGASIVLLIVLAIRGGRLDLSAAYIRYYLISGVLGVSGPQLIAYLVLLHIPAGLFATLITLSPLATFVIASLIDRQLLPLYRLAGIVIGLVGVSLATMRGFDLGDGDPIWLIVALGAPVLLAIGNLFRNRAYPEGADPLALAAGMLLSQAILIWPVMVYLDAGYSPMDLSGPADAVILIIGIITAVSYLVTFAIQRMTDGLGFSQVGYFATLSGVAAGALLFGEPLSLTLLGAIAILFVGLAITNGHVRWPVFGHGTMPKNGNGQS